MANIIRRGRYGAQIDHWERSIFGRGGTFSLDLEERELILGEPKGIFGGRKELRISLDGFQRGEQHELIIDRFGLEVLDELKEALRRRAQQQNVQIKREPGFSGQQLQLLSHGPLKIQVIKILREMLNIGLRQAKELAEAAPVALPALSDTQNRELQRRLQEVGALLDLGSSPPWKPASRAAQGACLELLSVGQRKISVIKAARDALGLGLREAKEWVESAPVQAKALSMEELKNFQTALEEAGARVRLIAAPQSSSSNEPQSEDWTLSLENRGPRCIETIKLVRMLFGLGLKDAKELVDSAPCIVKKGLSREEGEALILRFEKIGASVSLKKASL